MPSVDSRRSSVIASTNINLENSQTQKKHTKDLNGRRSHQSYSDSSLSIAEHHKNNYTKHNYKLTEISLSDSSFNNEKDYNNKTIDIQKFNNEILRLSVEIGKTSQPLSLEAAIDLKQNINVIQDLIARVSDEKTCLEELDRIIDENNIDIFTDTGRNDLSKRGITEYILLNILRTAEELQSSAGIIFKKRDSVTEFSRIKSLIDPIDVAETNAKWVRRGNQHHVVVDGVSAMIYRAGREDFYTDIVELNGKRYGVNLEKNGDMISHYIIIDNANVPIYLNNDNGYTIDLPDIGSMFLALETFKIKKSNNISEADLNEIINLDDDSLQVFFKSPQSRNKNITEFNGNQTIEEVLDRHESKIPLIARVIENKEANKTYYICNSKLSEVQLVDIDNKNLAVAVYFSVTVDGRPQEFCDGKPQGFYGVRECKGKGERYKITLENGTIEIDKDENQNWKIASRKGKFSPEEVAVLRTMQFAPVYVPIIAGGEELSAGNDDIATEHERISPQENHKITEDHNNNNIVVNEKLDIIDNDINQHGDIAFDSDDDVVDNIKHNLSIELTTLDLLAEGKGVRFTGNELSLKLDFLPVDGGKKVIKNAQTLADLRSIALKPLPVNTDLEQGVDEEKMKEIEFALDILVNYAFSDDENIRQWIAEQIPTLYASNPDYVSEACWQALGVWDHKLGGLVEQAGDDSDDLDKSKDEPSWQMALAASFHSQKLSKKEENSIHSGSERNIGYKDTINSIDLRVEEIILNTPMNIEEVELLKSKEEKLVVSFGGQTDKCTPFNANEKLLDDLHPQQAKIYTSIGDDRTEFIIGDDPTETVTLIKIRPSVEEKCEIIAVAVSDREEKKVRRGFYDGDLVSSLDQPLKVIKGKSHTSLRSDLAGAYVVEQAHLKEYDATQLYENFDQLLHEFGQLERVDLLRFAREQRLKVFEAQIQHDLLPPRDR